MMLRFLLLACAYTSRCEPEPEHPLAHVRCTREGRKAPCLDVATCPAGASKRAAVVVFYDCHGPLHKTPRLATTVRVNGEVARRDGFDYLWAIPPEADREDAFPDWLHKDYGIEIIEFPLPWIVPPNLSKGVPVESGGCCGAREFAKLQFLAMEKYDAVVVLDADVRLSDKAADPLRGVFDCAASGTLLTTRGSHSGVNGGFVAARPDSRRLASMLAALATATVDELSGWNGRGFGPFRKVGHPKFDARVQGFLYHFLYADAAPPFPAEQVDACVFNAQHNLAHLCVYELCTDAVRLSHGAAKPEARHCQVAIQRHRRNATHAAATAVIRRRH